MSATNTITCPCGKVNEVKWVNCTKRGKPLQVWLNKIKSKNESNNL